MMNSNGSGPLGLSPAVLLLIVLVVCVAAVAFVILVEEYGPRLHRGRRKSEKRMPVISQSNTNQGASEPRVVGGGGKAVAVPNPVVSTDEVGQPQPRPIQEKSLQDAARRSGIDIKILRGWAEQQRFKTTNEESRRAILRRLIDLEESEERKKRAARQNA